MPKAPDDQPLLPSVLDRLLDDQPGVSREPAKTRSQVLRELKQSLRRDLENLLNTRWRPRSWPESLAELEVSLVNYGIPDITGSDLGSSENRQQLAGVLERVIRRFEPRLTGVAVELLDNAEPLDRTLRFRIRGMLLVEPAPEPVAFDSALEPATGTVEIKGVTR
jgi:type VI secretion system protein ImpF